MGMLENTKSLMNISCLIANVEETEFENISIPYNVVEFQKSMSTTGIYRKHKQQQKSSFI